jgi:hypothetical protein
MKQAASLTLSVLKSHYPQAVLDTTGDGFAVSCTEEDDLKLMEDSALEADHIVDMVPVHMD